MPIAVGVGLGLLVTLPALFAAFMSAGAGHGDYVAARILFPLPMLLAVPAHYIGALSIAVGLLQFPIYGGLLGWSRWRRSYRAAIALAALHVVAAIACFAGVIPDL